MLLLFLLEDSPNYFGSKTLKSSNNLNETTFDAVDPAELLSLFTYISSVQTIGDFNCHFKIETNFAHEMLNNFEFLCSNV